MFVLVSSFIILMLIGVPIVWAMLAGAILFTIGSSTGALIALPHKMINGIDSFILVAIPLFLLVGQLMGGSGVLERLLHLSRCIVGRMAGGLSQVNIAVNMLMAGISGTATADCAACGSGLIPSMIRERYGRGFSAAVTAAASTIGPIIPPSVPMVALGALVGVSVGRLFLAGVVPGVLAGILLLLISYIISKRRGYGRIEFAWSWMVLLRAFISAIGPLMVPIVIVGGIVFGFFTPTESAAVAVALVLGMGCFVFRDLTVARFYEAARETLYLLGPVMLIVSAASVFGTLLIQEQAGAALTAYIAPLASSPTVLLLLISAAVLILGCFMEALAIMFLVAPVLMPMVTAVGLDPTHFGIVLVQALMIGLITPPVGISMFISCSIANVGTAEFTREVFPFFLVLVGTLLVSIYFPELILYLPKTLIP